MDGANTAASSHGWPVIGSTSGRWACCPVHACSHDAWRDRTCAPRVGSTSSLHHDSLAPRLPCSALSPYMYIHRLFHTKITLNQILSDGRKTDQVRCVEMWSPKCGWKFCFIFVVPDFRVGGDIAHKLHHTNTDGHTSRREQRVHLDVWITNQALTWWIAYYDVMGRRRHVL